MQTSRLLLGLEEFKKSIKILDTVIQEEDEGVEAWYLLAFCLCKLKKYQNAQECMKNVKMLVDKLKIEDQEFLGPMQELEETLTKGLKKE